MTIRELAKKLNLSITTVSRALDGYSDVAEETRRRVIEAAQEMGYEPSFAARQLRRKRTDTLGYILPTSSPRFSDPFYTTFLTGLCDEAASQNMDLLITSSPPESEEEKEQYRRMVQSHRVDGIILNRTRINDWRVEFLTEHKFPFVALGKGKTEAAFPYIDVTDEALFEELVAHLSNRGHQRIGFIGTTPSLVIQQDRFAGYLRGLERAGLEFDPALVRQVRLTENDGYLAARELLALPEPPTAILGINDLTALGAVRAAKEQGIYIGTELAIAGYDGIKETEYTVPPLTTVLQPTYEIARTLARMLVELIDGQIPPDTVVPVQPTLVIRASTG